MAAELTAAPVLSTPDDHLFDYEKPDPTSQVARSDDELREIYEVARTAREIRDGSWKCIALQFPDHMLVDAPRIVELLRKELDTVCELERTGGSPGSPGGIPASDGGQDSQQQKDKTSKRSEHRERIYILADTSYSACCVDEIAAEHVDAHVVVHYGRSCLSPTSRLPVIHVFTKHTLRLDDAAQSFKSEFPDKQEKVVLMADVTYQDHIPDLYRLLRDKGYESLLSTRIQHNPQGSIPNRTIVDPEDKQVKVNEEGGIDLKNYSIFHVSTPPNSLLLALTCRANSLHIFSTPDSTSPPTMSYYSPSRTARALLGRRYAKVLTLATAGIIGILVNTLSVANYLPSIDAIRRQITAAGKKSYTVVVGKLNPAKLANFAEIEGWVVVGCWESSLVEEDAGFYRPVITPFELEAALKPDDERIWGLDWWGGIESVDTAAAAAQSQDSQDTGPVDSGAQSEGPTQDSGVEVDEDDSDTPVFDLRTGKLVYHSKPMRMAAKALGEESGGRSTPRTSSDALAIRPKSELATVKGVLSPGAEYLRSQRTWQGLGSDFDDERSTAIEEGRSGVARGYTAGSDGERR